MEKILIIEDDLSIRKELSLLLGKNGYETLAPTTFDHIDEIIKEERLSLILLDVNLPDTDGFTLCSKIRKESKVPIIFVTSRNTEQDELKSMMLGGDDFITKPYNTSILLARIATNLKRSDPSYTSELILGAVKLNTHLSYIEYNGKILELSKNEFKIVYYLWIHNGKLIPKDEIIEYLWNNKFYVDENILNVNMTRIRKKLEEIELSDFIKTVRGKGYQI